VTGVKVMTNVLWSDNTLSSSSSMW